MRVQAIFRFVDLTFQGFQAGRELAHFQLLGCGQAQLIGAAGLYQIVSCTSLDGVDGGVDR
ncbi:hypothetical protein D3C78_1304040 [compost metagenome]